MAVDPHKHCVICNKPIPLDQVTCSEKCERVFAERQQKMRKNRLTLYLVFAAFIIVWLVMTIFKY